MSRQNTVTNLYRITGQLSVVKEGVEQTIPVDIQSIGATGADAANNYTRHLANYDRVQWIAGPFAELVESESEK